MLLSEVITKYTRVARQMPATAKKIHGAVFAQMAASLQLVGTAALMANVDAADHEAATRFIGTFTAMNSGLVARFTLRQPEQSEAGDDSDVTAADVELWFMAGVDSKSGDNADGKVLDGRDADLEETVRRMKGLLVWLDKDAKRHGDGKRSIEDIRKEYLGYIRAFKLKLGGPKLEAWSRIVLRAWLNYLHAIYPEIAGKEIRQLIGAK